MAKWINVAAVNELLPGRHIVFDLVNTTVLITNVDGQFYAVENTCSHDGGELSDGEINGTEITCARHGARFCLKTGAVLSAPAFEDIDTYPVRINDGNIQVYDEIST